MLLPLAALLSLAALPQDTPPAPSAPAPHAMPGEEAVDPYVPSPDNAGTRPFDGDGMARAFNGQAGIRRVVEGMVRRAFDDPRIGEIFMGHDRVRITRTLFEQFCFILNAGCTYTGRDMA